MASSSGCAPTEGAKSLPGAAGKDGSASPSEARVPTQDQRFARQHRLTARRQYLAVYAESWRVSSDSFTVFAAPNRGGDLRLGLTVPKRIGKACRRNRAKRLLREVFRTHRAALPAGLDLVVNARGGIDRRSYAEIEREFLASIARLQSRRRRGSASRGGQ